MRSSSLGRLVALAFAIITLGQLGEVRAQNNTVDPAVRFVNASPFERFEWGTATIPFAEGEWQPGDRWEAEDVPSELTPFGARWPDGSVRFAKLSAKVLLAPWQDRVINIRRAIDPPLDPFELSRWTEVNLQNFDFQFFVNTSTGLHTAPLVPHSIVEVGASRFTVLFRNRIPNTDLLYELWVTFFDDQDHARFELRLTCGKPSSSHWLQPYESFGFAVRSAVPFVRNAAYHNIIASAPELFGWNSVVLEHVPNHLYDAQSMEWYGNFFFGHPGVSVWEPMQRLNTAFAAIGGNELYGVATNWPASGAFGPFGVVPEAPPWWTDGGLWHAQTEYDEFLQYTGQPAESTWADRPMGLSPDAPAPGDQYDFGTTQLGDIVRSTYPHRIDEARFCVGEEAMRPGHFVEEDGSPVKAADHPGWITWSGRAHHSDSVSPDRLGKPHPEPWLSNNANFWRGRDNQHWSSNTMAAAYLLTTSHSLLREVNTDIELYLSGHTLPSTHNLSTNGIGASRAVGRTLLSMAWHYVVTGREDVRQRIADRVEECVAVQYQGLGGVDMKPIRYYAPDPRVTVTTNWWSGWEEGIAAAGLEAVWRVTGSQTAKDLAVACATSLLWHGWNMDMSDLRITYAMAYQPNGQALSPAQLASPDWAEWANSNGLREWCIPATKIARNYGIEIGDQETVDRANAILNQLHAERQPQLTGRWDRFANWEAL